MNFIERLLHVSPDGGHGSIEILVFLVLATALMVFAGWTSFVAYAQDPESLRRGLTALCEISVKRAYARLLSLAG
jgi:hypothetical protein